MSGWFRTRKKQSAAKAVPRRPRVSWPGPTTSVGLPLFPGGIDGVEEWGRSASCHLAAVHAWACLQVSPPPPLKQSVQVSSSPSVLVCLRWEWLCAQLRGGLVDASRVAPENSTAISRGGGEASRWCAPPPPLFQSICTFWRED